MKRTKRKRTAKRRSKRMSGVQQYAPNVVSGVGRRKKSKRGRRRSRVGYVTGNEQGDTLVGALLGVGVGILFDKFAPISNPVISDGIKTAGGGAAYVMVKNPLIKGAGLGLAIYGAGSLVKSSGLVAGMEEFVRGIGKGDELLIEMNGTDVELNSTNLIGNQNEYAPSVIGEGDEIVDTKSEMPSIVSGY
jgi:hypothetical protein